MPLTLGGSECGSWLEGLEAETEAEAEGAPDFDMTSLIS